MKVCIVGTSRCGTTLLRSMLHQHPELKLFNETHWLPKMYEQYGHQKVTWHELLAIAEKTSWDTGRDLFDVNQEYSVFSSRDELLQAFRAELRKTGHLTIAEFSDTLARVAFDNPVNWGDKTPDYGYYMAQIQSLWPQCRFIHIVRDGLVTARSMSRHSGCQLMVAAGYDNWCALSYDRLYEKYPLKASPLPAFIASWCRRMRRIRDEATRLARGSYLEVNYENLLSSPHQALQRICQFLQLTDSEEWRAQASASINPDKAGDAAALKPQLALLSLPDLRTLNSGSGARYFEQYHKTTAALTDLLHAQRALQGGDPGAAEHLALSVLAAPARIQTATGLRVGKRLLLEALQQQERHNAANLWTQRLPAKLRDQPLPQLIAELQQELAAAPAPTESAPTAATPTPKTPAPPPLKTVTNTLPAGLRLRSPAPVTYPASGVCVFACVRNELQRLPYFLQYHRDLGVVHFFIVDNHSDDGSAEFLQQQTDCTLFWTDQPYSASRCGVDWLNAMLDCYAVDRWALVLDADELLVYPNCEQLSLDTLVASLEASGNDALQTFLLDMYADKPLREVTYQSGQSFIDTCPYFDGDGYEYAAGGAHQGVPLRGGVRKRLFWQEQPQRGNPPVLMKTPLLRWRQKLAFKASTHLIDGLQRAAATGALLHFKLFDDFYTSVQRESERGEHWDGAAQYQAYWQTLQRCPLLNPMYSGSQRYHSSLTLVALGLMRMPLNYPRHSQTDIQQAESEPTEIKKPLRLT